MANNKMFPWWKPKLCGSELNRIAEVLESNFLNDGDYTSEFENRIADMLGVKHAVAVTSGTTALFLALKALDVGPGDEVIVPDVTFIATANAVALTGAKPVLVDIDPSTMAMDPVACEEAITIYTRAVVPVHVSGRGAPMAAINALANQYSLAVVEDAAEALLSKSKGEFLGTIGKAGCFSFSPNKTITTGQGGMVVTNDERVNSRLRELKDQGRTQRGTGGDDLHPSVGYNFKLTNLQAAVGLAQLEDLHLRTENLQDIYDAYETQLSTIDQLKLLPFDTDVGEVPQWIDAVADHRDDLVRHLEHANMHCRRFWRPIHTQKPYELPDAQFPNSTTACSKAVWLPSCFDLNEDDIVQICDQIKQFYKSGCRVAA